MKVLIAGASGAIGRPLITKLRAAGHEVFGTTRQAERFATLEALGAAPLRMDALDSGSVELAMQRAAPDVVIDLLTDLATRDFAANTRLRIEGTRTLVAAARSAGIDRLIAESISWVVAPGPVPATEEAQYASDATPGVRELESAVLEVPTAIVLRYGLLYGPGTWYSAEGFEAEQAHNNKLTSTTEVVNFVHVNDAAQAALDALVWPGGVVNVVDDEPAHACEWMPAFADAVGAPAPLIPSFDKPGRAVSNAKARALGWRPQYPSWREGFSTIGPQG